MSDPFEQIGPKLTAAREAAGLTIEEAARKAQVPRGAAESLEAENFSTFPSPVYAKSFLMQYSEFLGVDAHTWLDALEPGSFMASGALLQGPEKTRQQPEETSEQRGGVLSVFILLLVSAAIVVAAIKGCELFESRLERQTPPATDGGVGTPGQ